MVRRRTRGAAGVKACTLISPWGVPGPSCNRICTDEAHQHVDDCYPEPTKPGGSEEGA